MGGPFSPNPVDTSIADPDPAGGPFSPNPVPYKSVKSSSSLNSALSTLSTKVQLNYSAFRSFDTFLNSFSQYRVTVF